MTPLCWSQAPACGCTLVLKIFIYAPLGGRAIIIFLELSASQKSKNSRTKCFICDHSRFGHITQKNHPWSQLVSTNGANEIGPRSQPCSVGHTTVNLWPHWSVLFAMNAECNEAWMAENVSTKVFVVTCKAFLDRTPLLEITLVRFTHITTVVLVV